MDKNAASKKGMIRPFVSKQIRKGKISFGLSSYGMMQGFLMSLKYLQT